MLSDQPSVVEANGSDRAASTFGVLEETRECLAAYRFWGMKAEFELKPQRQLFLSNRCYLKDKILYINSKPTRAKMLPQSQRECYQAFQNALEKLHQTVAASDLQVATLRDRFQDVQQLFQSQIASLIADEVSPDYASRWQSIQTEIYKQMRLLETDLMLLQASRSSATSRSRASTVGDRINTLIKYCEALLQL